MHGPFSTTWCYHSQKFRQSTRGVKPQNTHVLLRLLSVLRDTRFGLYRTTSSLRTTGVRRQNKKRATAQRSARRMGGKLLAQHPNSALSAQQQSDHKQQKRWLSKARCVRNRENREVIERFSDHHRHQRVEKKMLYSLTKSRRSVRSLFFTSASDSLSSGRGATIPRAMPSSSPNCSSNDDS